MGNDSMSDKNSLPVRLFIGNLVSTISDDALKGSLSNFGTVTNFNRSQERNFVHLNLVSKDEKSLEKCISVLNQTRWMGTVLRVEIAKEHYTERLKREWTAELDVTDAKSDLLEPTAQNINTIKSTFSWTGKRVNFEDENNSCGTSHDNSELVEEMEVACVNEIPGSPKTTNNGEAAVTLDFFGLKRTASPAKTNVIKTQGEVATVDLFGLNYDGDEQEPVIESRTSKRKHNQSKQSEESVKADRDAMSEIGNDPSKIDVSEEHDRARAIMAKMFGNICGNNEVSKCVTMKWKRKSWYTKFMKSRIGGGASDITQPTVPCSSELWVPSFSPVSEVVDRVHRRKALYHTFHTHHFA